MATLPQSPPQRARSPLLNSCDFVTIAHTPETIKPVSSTNMNSLPNVKSSSPVSALPFAPLTFSSPCNFLPENPVQLAPTSLDFSSVVTPEDQSSSAFPRNLQCFPVATSPQPKSLQQPCSLESHHPQSLQQSTPSLLPSSLPVPPTLFDFIIDHPHSQPNLLQQVCPSLQSHPPVTKFLLLLYLNPPMTLTFLQPTPLMPPIFLQPSSPLKPKRPILSTFLLPLSPNP